MWYPKRMFQISCTAKETNAQKTATSRSLMNKILQHTATFCSHVMRGKKLEYMTTRMIRERQIVKILDGLTKLLDVGQAGYGPG